MIEKIKKHPAQTFIIALVIIYTIFVIYSWIGRWHWDFSSYYCAVLAYENGLSPYDNESLQIYKPTSVPIEYSILPFLYPPATIKLFSLLSFFSHDEAQVIMFSVKVIIAGLLIFTWWFLLEERLNVTWFILLTIFGFSATIMGDLRAGNVSIIENFLLWLGLAFYVKNRRIFFVLLVCCAAIFKLTPLFFLILLLTPPVSHVAIYVSFIFCFTYALINLFFWPDLTAGFLSRIFSHSMPNLSDDISFRAFLMLLNKKVATFLNIGFNNTNITIFWIIIGIIFITATAVAEKKSIYSNSLESRLRLIFICAALYVIFLPRIGWYQIISAIPAVLFFIVTMTAYQQKTTLLSWLLIASFTKWGNLLPIVFKINPLIERFHLTLMIISIWFVYVFVKRNDQYVTCR